MTKNILPSIKACGTTEKLFENLPFMSVNICVNLALNASNDNVELAMN